MALHVLDEANRCLGCKKPMCQQGCPIHTNIPEVIRLLKANQLDDAGRMLFENNPLTTVCALVCNHENQCEGHCIRNRMPSHDPVHFSIIEDYISTTYANKMVAGPAPKNGMKAAVVGAGPAGLTIAVLLARWGYDITIFDARDKIGGVMRYGIPNYRLPDSVLDDFQYHHLDLKGIHFRPNTTIGKTITIDDLFRDGYKSVFIGAGLWKANAMHIKGETLGNVAFGIDYLANSKAFRLGDDIAVIGVGNSAMDCARTAIRNGARHVTCYARRDESCISASEYEVSYAKLEGVGFRFCKAPVEIRENGLICRDTVKGEDGKFTQVEGSEIFYPHTGVIVSVSQGSESNLVKTTTGIETNQKGLLTVSEDGSTTREGVFAGGDAVMGARTVVEAVAVAKKVAEPIVAYIKSLPTETLGNMRQIILDGYLNGRPIRDIQKDIQSEYGTSKRHAQLLARDQLATLNAQITKMQQTDAGCKKYRWSTSHDSRVRPCHAALNGKTFDWNDPPEMWYDTKAGRVYTGRKCHPGEDYCCRCVAIPVFDYDGVNIPMK